MNRTMVKFMMGIMGIDKKFEELYVLGFHTKFEKADEENDTEFFNWFYNHPHPEMKLCSEFMELHMKNTDTIFEWKNYKNWLNGWKCEQAFIKKFNEERDIHRTTESPTLNGKKLSPKEFLEMKMNKKLTEEEFQAILKAQQELYK